VGHERGMGQTDAGARRDGSMGELKRNEKHREPK